jgi:hypothetical protein
MRAGHGYYDASIPGPIFRLPDGLRKRQMIRIRAAAVLGFVLLCNSAGRAEEANAELPPDGWWVQYVVTTKGELKGGRSLEQTMKRRFSLVGTVTENRVKCRWVEIKSVGRVAGEEHVQINKLLVPETDLLESERPLNNLVRWWRQNNDHVVRSTTGRARLLLTNEMFIFPGLRQNSEIIDKQNAVEFQERRLQIAQGSKGSIEQKADESLTYNFEFTVWHHSAVPLGFAAAKTRKTTRVNGELQSSRDDEWVIDDFGTGATSELPEND